MGLSSLRACVLVPCPLGVPVPRSAPGSVGWGGVVPSALLGHVPPCPSASVSSPVFGVAAVAPSPSGFCAVASVWWPLQWKVAGVVVWRLGCGGGLCGVPPSPCVGVPPFPCAGTGGWWPRADVVRPVSGLGCGGGRVPLAWSALCLGVAVSLGGLAVSTGCGGWGGAGPCGVAGPSFVVRVLVPVVASSSPVPWPLPFPFLGVGGPLVVLCPRVVLPPLSCPCGCLPVTLRLSWPPCRGPSLCPSPFRCAGGAVVARSVEC